MHVQMTVTAVERRPGHATRINLANASNDYFVEITTKAPAPDIEPGHSYILAILPTPETALAVAANIWSKTTPTANFGDHHVRTN